VAYKSSIRVLSDVYLTTRKKTLKSTLSLTLKQFIFFY